MRITLVATLFLCANCASILTNSTEHKNVTYLQGKAATTSYIAYPIHYNNDTPLVFIFHEAWQQKAMAQKSADSLAAEGYIAMTVDIYGGNAKAHNPKMAKKYAERILKHKTYIKNAYFDAKKAVVENMKTNLNKVAVIGYASGGDVALELAKISNGPDVVISFYSHFYSSTAMTDKKIYSSLLLFNAKNDSLVSTDKLNQFYHAAAAASAEVLLVNYPDAQHGFTNPQAAQIAQKYNLPLAYSERADKDSWQKMLMFLKRKWL